MQNSVELAAITNGRVKCSSRDRNYRQPTAECGPLIVQIAEVNFTCPNCGSFYEVQKVKAPPDSVDPQSRCPTCAGQLPAREAQFSLRYFHLRKARTGWQRTPLISQPKEMVSAMGFP